MHLLKRRVEAAALLCLVLAITAGAQTRKTSFETGPTLHLSTFETGRYTDIFAENKTLADITMKFDTELTNTQTTQKMPLVVTVPPLSKIKVTRLVPIFIEKEWSYGFTYESFLGALDAAHDDGYVYRLPFMVGEEFTVGQSFDGDFTHFGESCYAVDFDMPIGSLVCAAREGVVVDVADSSSRGGSDPKYIDDGNHIYVRHADRTIAMYAHFKKGGAEVAVGDTVARGQVIGLSGNTGYSSGPHLHFSVHTLINGQEGSSTPIRFETSTGIVVIPVKGRAYRAVM